MVSQLRVSQIILEATFDLTQTLMPLSLGSCGGFFFPIWKHSCALTLAHMKIRRKRLDQECYTHFQNG